MAALEEAMQRAFELRVRSHLRACFPESAAAYSDDQLLSIIHENVARARGYGITLEEDVTRFLEYVVLYGPEFDLTQPWARDILNDIGSGTEKIDRMDDYYEFVR